MRALLGALLSLAAFAASAQDWPTRPVTMIVPYAAGGPVDTVGRIMAQGLSEVLGQQVVIENVGGAGGMTGANRVAKATPDGYTFLLGGSATLTLVPALYGKKTLYDPLADFAHVVQFADSARVLIARKDFPASSLKEFVAYAKDNHGKMQYGSSGTGAGAHICALLLDQQMGVKVTHVPYRGSGPAIQDLLPGNVAWMFETFSTMLQHHKAGKLRILAFAHQKRAAIAPEIPTMIEAGVPGFEAYTFNLFLGPAGTPQNVVDTIDQATRKVMADPSTIKFLEDIAAVPTPDTTPQRTAKFIQDELAKWAPVIKAAGIKQE